MGWCERHHVKKTADWIQLCKTRPAYFAAWEEGRGPGQKPIEWNVNQPSRGLGDTVAKVTHAVGIKPCVGCKKRQVALNIFLPYR